MSRKWSLLLKNSLPAILFACIAPIVASAEFVLGPEKPVSSPVTENLTRAVRVDVASDGNTALAVWNDRRSDRGADIVATRVDRLGRVLDLNGIVITSSIQSETAPLVAYDGARFLVVWGDGTNTWGAKINDRGAITSGPTILAPGRPTGLAFNVRIMAVAIENNNGTNIYEVRSDLTIREMERLPRVTGVEIAALGFGFVGVFVETPFDPIGNYTVSALRMDRNGSIGNVVTIAEIGSFEVKPTFAVGNLGEEAVIAAGAEDHMAVVRMAFDGAITLIERDNTFVARSIEDVTGFSNGFDVLAIVANKARIFRHTSAGRTEFEPVTGAPSNAAGAFHNNRIYSVWQVGGQVIGRFTLADDEEPQTLLARAVANQQMPAIATAGAASLVAWTEDISDTRSRIMARIISNDGTPDTSVNPLVVGTRTIHFDGSRPALTFNGTNYFAAWLDQRSEPTRPAVLVVRPISTRGVLAGFIDISTNAAPSSPPALASGAGDVLILFSEGLNNPQLKGVFLSDANTKFDIPDLTTDPAVVYGEGSYLVVAETADGAIKAVFLSRSGITERTSFETVPPFGELDSKPAVAWNGTSSYLVVFRRGTSIYGRLLARNGDTVRTDFRIAEDVNADNPQVVFDGGSYVVAWSVKTTEDPATDSDVYATRVFLNGDVETPQLIAAGGRHDDYPALLGLGGNSTLIAYQQMTPELQNVHRVFSRVLTAPPPPPPPPAPKTKRRSVR